MLVPQIKFQLITSFSSLFDNLRFIKLTNPANCSCVFSLLPDIMAEMLRTQPAHLNIRRSSCHSKTYFLSAFLFSLRTQCAYVWQPCFFKAEVSWNNWVNIQHRSQKTWDGKSYNKDLRSITRPLFSWAYQQKSWWCYILS